MIPPILRRTAIFGSVAGLGFVLAWLLGATEGRPGKSKPRIPVVPLPSGTSLQTTGGAGGISLVRADKLVVAPVLELTLDDGTKVPFRSMVLRGDAERPLPSPREDVSRVLITNPDLQLLPPPLPRTRAEYEASSREEPTTIRAPEGVLDNGPRDAMVLRCRGGVKVRSVRDGTPWDFAAEEAVSDVLARTLKAEGPVSLASRDLRVEGRDLDAAETTRTVVLSGGAAGSVESTRGVRIAGGSARGATRFRCRGPFRILPLPVPAEAAGKIERWRLVLEEDAVVEQDDGSLAARHIEADITRPVSDAKGDTSVDEVRAEGTVVLSGRGEGREFRATAAKLLARPEMKGTTNAWLDGSPAVFVKETSGGRDVRTLEIHGDGTARLGFPASDGPVDAVFRGGARAILLEPPAKAGDAERRRDLRAATLTLAGMRAGGGPTKIGSLVADGQALLQDGDRTAQAKRIEFRPVEGGGSRSILDGDVLLSWPAAGALDPVSALSPADANAAPADAGGTMLLSTPGRAVLEQPADDDRSTGTHFTVEGGAVLRRVAVEREIYRLTCASVDARTPPGARGLDLLRATGDVRLAGREEGEGGRRYDLRGETLDVRGAPGTRGARTAALTGPADHPASASFAREDGSPFTIAARTLRFDNVTGGFRAEEGVRGTGVLPEGKTPGVASSGGGPAELACGVLEGVLVRGDATGSTRVVSLDARDAVWIRTATHFVSGDRLVHDAAKGTLLLTGDPARVTARSATTPRDLKLEDACEASALLLVLADGNLVEARSEDGGRVAYHSVPRAEAGKAPPPPERIEARCSGPLVHRPGETILSGKVSALQSAWKGGAFVPVNRIEGADEVRVLHPPATGQAGRLNRVTASSAGGRITVEARNDSGGFTAEGVSRADIDLLAKTVIVESSPNAPRVRIRTAEVVGTCRRAIFNYDRGVLVETLAMTMESGK